MPNLKINDVPVTVETGTLLLDACRQAGFEIPHYCYHPALTAVATCRMCMVEIKGQPKLATSCTTLASEGMEVSTQTPAVADARAAGVPAIRLGVAGGRHYRIGDLVWLDIPEMRAASEGFFPNLMAAPLN